MSHHILQYCKKINIIYKSSWKTSQKKIFPILSESLKFSFRVTSSIYILLAYPSIFFVFSILFRHIHLYPSFLFFSGISIYILAYLYSSLAHLSISFAYFYPFLAYFILPAPLPLLYPPFSTTCILFLNFLKLLTYILQNKL